MSKGFHSLYKSFSKVVVLTIKELIQLSRDKALLMAIFYLFTADIFLSGSVHMELNRANLIVYDRDRNEFSRDLVYSFRPPYFLFLGEVFEEKEAIDMLDRGDGLIFLDIPERFKADLSKGVSAEVQIMIDGSNTVLGTLAATYSAQIVELYGKELLLKHMKMSEEKLINLPVVINQPRVWYNPNQNDTWFAPISELLTVITILSLMLPAAAAVREKERGTIEQLLVSPLHPVHIMIPKILSMTFVIVVGTAVAIFVAIMGYFEVPVKGSLLLFFSMTALYTVAVSGMGLFISTLCRNIAQVALMALMLGIPIVILSGVWTPPEAMPTWLRRGIHLSPLYYFIDMSYGILLKGSGLSILWKQLVGLITLGVAVFAFGTYRFSRQFK